jgi:3'-5' exoribonuclease
LKTHFVRELEPNRVVTSFFIVHAKEIRLKKSGEPYLSLTLADRTGTLDAKMWDGVSEVADTFDRDDFVKVKGLVQVFRNKPQMTVHKLRRLDDSEVNFADYFPHTEKNIDELWAALRAAAAGIASAPLRSLIDSFLDDEEVARRLRVAPAAKSLHHARIGGLLEHIVSLLGLCCAMAQHYDFVDLDLLVAIAVLHDLGKIYELQYQRSFGYSTEGQLLGHMIIVLDMLQAKAAAIPDFPPRLKTLLEHMILSHHGHYEFGSPKLPMFPEALLFHYLDDLDSKLESMRATIRNDQNIGGEWTSFNPALERPLLKKDRFLAGPERPGPKTPPSSAAPPAAKAESRPTAFGELLQSALNENGGTK